MTPVEPYHGDVFDGSWAAEWGGFVDLVGGTAQRTALAHSKVTRLLL